MAGNANVAALLTATETYATAVNAVLTDPTVLVASDIATVQSIAAVLISCNAALRAHLDISAATVAVTATLAAPTNPPVQPLTY